MPLHFDAIKDGDGVTILRDPWVLVVVVLLWGLVIFKYWHDRMRLRRLAAERLASYSSAFVLAAGDDDVLAEEGGELNKRQCFFYQPRPSRDDKIAGEEALSHTKRIRTWEGFRDRDKAAVPPDPHAHGVTYQRQFTTISRFVIYKSMQNGAMKQCVSFMLLNAAFAVTLSYILRTSQDFSDYTGTDFITEEAVLGNFQAASEVQSALLPLVCFILGLFINMKLTWYQGVITESWSIQGQLNDIALEMGCVLGRREGEEWLRMKYRLYRYLTAVHFLLYWRVDEHYASTTLRDLLDVHLITAREKQMLQNAPTGRNLILLWIGDLFQEASDKGAMSDYQLTQMFENLKKLRNGVQQTGRESWTVYFWPAFGSMLVSLFYQGGMRLITVMERPFGSDLDDLDSDWLLLSSERAIFGYLTDPYPTGVLAAEAGDEFKPLPSHNTYSTSRTPSDNPIINVSVIPAGETHPFMPGHAT
eukprot:CAMPEP_0206484514 /NCGR_PEP_ID=MMETSP0324_2-20121206/40020_1 /ASSEMBLY_ACC=CAM_ASM_000836 /TAXON_ID=2866 /ORGANISM="Crypthecodinium cohnii, Strain Seligo" /LENGTH=473 /DNA_ID=CAMNT_0053962677 /DNA_START=76 /DNA_END=1498 /DNA_ORIENTATION=-